MTTTWLIVHVPYITKTRQDNDMTNYTSAVDAKNETELSWPIEQDTIYPE